MTCIPHPGCHRPRTVGTLAVSLCVLWVVPPSVAAQPAGSEIRGVYTGSYVCTQRQISLQLALEPETSGAVTGVFTFFMPGGSAENPVGAFRVAGSFDRATRTLRMQPREWVKRAPLYMPVGFSGTFDASGSTIKGTIAGPGCTTFEASRDAQATARLAKAAADRASRYDSAPTSLAQARTPDERCLVLGKWVSKLKREYPDTDVMRSVVDQLSIKAANLFSDEEFVPVFGKPYDQFSEADRQVPRQAIQHCSQYADSPEDRTLYGVVLVRPFLPGQGGAPGSFTFADVASMLAYRRTLRQQRGQLLAEVKALPPTEASFARAVAIRDKEMPAFEALWPSEYRELREAVDAAMLGVATPGLNAWVSSVVQGASGLEGLNAITSALARLSSAGRPDPRSGGRPAPNAAHPGGVPGAAPAAGSGPDAIIAAASPQARQQAEATLRARASTIVAELVKGEAAKLEGFGTGAVALEAGSTWYRHFSTLFGQFQSEPPVRAAQEALEARRRQDRAAGARDVLARVNAATTPQQLSAVLNTYLGVPADQNDASVSEVFAVAAERRRTLTAQAERAAEAARSVGNYCSRLPSNDREVPGEPSSRDMCLAVADVMDGVNDGYRDIQRSCAAGNYRNNPILGIQCIALCGATVGTCELSVQMTRFEKIGCADAKATGKPGFNCDYVLRYAASSANVQQALSAVAPAGSIVQSRFVKRGDVWIRLLK
jgi:hypothetical protein